MVVYIFLFMVSMVLFIDVVGNGNESNRNVFFVAISLFVVFNLFLLIYGSHIRSDLQTYTYRVERYQELKKGNNVNNSQIKKLRSKIINQDNLNTYKINNENEFLYDIFIHDEDLKKALKARKKFENMKVEK